MAFNRGMIRDAGGLERPVGPGDGLLSAVVANTNSADSAQTLSVANIMGGLYIRSGMTADRTDTTATAADILAANPHMNVGDSFLLLISVTVAFALTLAGGTGVTMGSKTAIAASSWGIVVFTKTSATTMTATLL